jgi:hypothetical protein
VKSEIDKLLDDPNRSNFTKILKEYPVRWESRDVDIQNLHFLNLADTKAVKFTGIVGISYVRDNK